MNFTALGEFRLQDGRRVVSVLNPSTCSDFGHLIGAAVTVDGQAQIVDAVERFTHAPPWREGEKIGLLLRS